MEPLTKPPSSQTNRDRKKQTRAMRRRFLKGLAIELRVVWPILSALILIIVGLGTVVGLFEGWPLRDSFYFSFITGLTIGYGDLAPKLLVTRVLAVCIGATGILLTALMAAVAVNALNRDENEGES